MNPMSSNVGYSSREGAQRAPRPVTPRATRTRAVRPRPYDPFAALTQAQIQQNAQTSIQAQIAPVLKQIETLFAQRNQQGSQAITDYSAKLAQTVAPFAQLAGQAYADAEGKQQALDSSLKSNLTSGGQADANALASQLAAAGQNTAPTQAVASAGASAGATRYALGSASLAQLIANAAHAQEYGSKQPGIAAATGRQTMRDFQSQLNNELGTQTGQLKSQVPGMIQSYLTDAQNREYQKALARASGMNAQQQTAYKQWLDQQHLAQGNQRIAQGNARINNQASQAAQRQQLAVQRQQVAAQKAAQKQQANQGKAVAARGKAFDTNRKQAYAKAATLHNAGSASSLLGSSVGAKSAYQTLWAQYGKPLMRYTSASGRRKWGHQVDTMIRTALMTAGYGAGELPPARF